MYNIIGIMSGSSLDGLDIAYCTFTPINEGWSYDILFAECMPYPLEWQRRLRQAPRLNGRNLWQLHIEYGHYLGKTVQIFIEKYQLQQEILLIASHGHTIFHEPSQKMTCQIGDGAAIAFHTQKMTICDFRSSDLAAGGQGAPMVPILDRWLFKDHLFCLNIGGIANISAKTNSSMIGFDVCYANQVLNRLAQQLKAKYDKDGMLARHGQVIPALLDDLSRLPFLAQDYPKSLNNQGVATDIMPLLRQHSRNPFDLLRTFTEHIAQEVKRSIDKIYSTEQLPQQATDSLLVTGGGAFNVYLIDRIRYNIGIPIIVPNKRTIEFKEALLMAFAGLLRHQQQNNFYREVTGAERNVVGGGVYL